MLLFLIFLFFINFQPNTDEIFLPATLPKKYEQALTKREVDHKVKAGIVREVCSNLAGHNQTDNKYLQKAAKKMVKQWSPLKDPIDPENVSSILKIIWDLTCGCKPRLLPKSWTLLSKPEV